MEQQTPVDLPSPPNKLTNFWSRVRQNFNQNGSNVLGAHTEMEQQTPVDLPSPPPKPANFWSRVGQTRLITETTNRALGMLPSRLRNCPAPPEVPTAETEALFQSRHRQVPPASSYKRVAVITGVVILSLLVIFSTVFGTSLKWTQTDNSSELYNRYDVITTQTDDSTELPSTPAEKTNKTKQSRNCVVPEHPEHGKYVVVDNPTAKPRDSFNALKLTVNCLPDYRVLGQELVFCVTGSWSNSYPTCVRFCKLDNHTSVRYDCLVTGSSEGRRPCNAYEPSGTVVEAECNSPNYYSADTLSTMKCINGSWDHIARCFTECGRVGQYAEPLITDGKSAKPGELPWHVGIYKKNSTPYEQICGGSLVSHRVVISAAHCFCKDGKQLPASRFAVAAGKIYRPWNNKKDKAQKSNVKEINIPVRFQGRDANDQEDIAVLILETPFMYLPSVIPVCLSFDYKFETSQLQHGSLGKVAGWGLTAENGNSSQILKYVELPYVDVKQCIKNSSTGYKGYITSDKICAGYGNGTALCKGDSGGGLVFPHGDRYYLRGIVSTALALDEAVECNIYALNTFTEILKHENFIKRYL